MTTNKEWWGEFAFNQDETKCWRIGDRFIAIKRSEREWTIWNNESANEINKPVIVNKQKSRESFQDVSFERFMVCQTTDTVHVEPSLADRSIIVRPSKPLVVMPFEKIQLYVSTPIWMTISVPNIETPMSDIPFWRPSDSWFGPSTMSGDICYSKYTDAKVKQEDLEMRSHRASTMVTVTNDQEEPLIIQRLNLPVPSLKTYSNGNGHFWTDQISILQRTEHSKPVSHVKHSPPEDVHTMTQVSESRELSNKSSFLSSIKNLIG